MPGNWARHAACAGRCKSIFFPADYQNNRQWILAKRICADCPVKAPCLAYGLEHNMSGVWGGTSGNDRRKMKRGTRKRLAS